MFITVTLMIILMKVCIFALELFFPKIGFMKYN